MSAIQFEIFPAPEKLKNDIECFRIMNYTHPGEIAIRVCPSGFPGIAFQHHNGKSVITSIRTPSEDTINIPTLFLYGQVTKLSVMHFKTPFFAMQAIFKPHALKTFLDIDASTLTNKSLAPQEFGAEKLNKQLIQANSDQEKITLLSDFLISKQSQMIERDVRVEEGLSFIQENIGAITVEDLREYMRLPERQLERRFKQVVGVSPQFYIRIKRINAAMKLMDSGQYGQLVDIAHALNFHDQSHFIRDIKEFSGIAPKSILQKVNDFHHDRAGSSYTYI